MFPLFYRGSVRDASYHIPFKGTLEQSGGTFGDHKQSLSIQWVHESGILLLQPVDLKIPGVFIFETPDLLGDFMGKFYKGVDLPLGDVFAARETFTQAFDANLIVCREQKSIDLL